jgi:hypothetical protein
MQNIQTILGTIVALGLAWALFRNFQTKQKAYASQGQAFLFRDIKSLLKDSEIKQGDAIGTWKLDGHFKGQFFQIQTIVDTLATRKLPILWLMVTLPKQQPVSATTNLMMRPSGPTSFSKFDFLPHTVRTPQSFPEHAVIKTDETTYTPPFFVIEPHLDLFRDGPGKELLLSPKGLRIVVMAAQADRARYGVFREANFGETVIDIGLTEQILNMLLELQKSLELKNA